MSQFSKLGTIKPILREKNKIFLHFVVLFKFCCNFANEIRKKRIK
jgi:hypothetical protein